MSAPGCRFQPLAVCFQEVPRAEAAGYSRSNRHERILLSTVALSIGSRRRNLQQPRSNPRGVTCHPQADAEGSAVLRDASILRRMPYKIEWIGTVALGVSTEGGRSLAFSLADGQQVPPEFKVGDPVKIANYPEHPSVVAMGMENEGYYEFTHIPTGTVFRTQHRDDMYKVEEK